jgi:hypothetical protein
MDGGYISGPQCPIKALPNGRRPPYDNAGQRYGSPALMCDSAHRRHFFFVSNDAELVTASTVFASCTLHADIGLCWMRHLPPRVTSMWRAR